MADEQGVTGAGSPPEGTPRTEDVTPAASSPAEGVQDSPTSGRTLENLAAEMHRRDQERQKQLDSVLAWISSQGMQRPAAAPAVSQPQSEPTDDELWTLAQQGDRQAFEAYQRRIARREVDQKYGQQSRQNLVQAQLQSLVNRYPVLRDTSHPLTQTVQQAYALLLQAGYTAGAETLLEATKTAIADRPDLITELYNQAPQAREQSRQGASQRAQSGVTGSTVRQSSSSAPNTKLNPAEIELAKRMLHQSERHSERYPEEKTIEQRVKGARERFVKRIEAGQSQLGAIGGQPSVQKEMEDFS